MSSDHEAFSWNVDAAGQLFMDSDPNRQERLYQEAVQVTTIL